jgi:hypothetical protein
MSELVRTDDIWWANDWSHGDVFETVFVFDPGDSYTLLWVGFEGCCGGTSTIRFSVDGSAYLPLTDSNFGPFTTPSPSPIPEPGTFLLLAFGLVLLGVDGVFRRTG